MSSLASRISELAGGASQGYKEMSELCISKMAEKVMVNASPKKVEKVFEKNLKGQKEFSDSVLAKELSFEKDYTRVVLNLS